jgi:hypothetical protein
MLRRARDSMTRDTACLTFLFSATARSMSWFNVGSLSAVHHDAIVAASALAPVCGCDCHSSRAGSGGSR